MKNRVTVSVKGKTYEVEYVKRDDEYVITVPDPVWTAPLPNPFHIIAPDDRKTRVVEDTTPQSEEIVLEVIEQIKRHEAQRGQA